MLQSCVRKAKKGSYAVVEAEDGRRLAALRQLANVSLKSAWESIHAN
jgi:hypothetical protein